MKARTLTMLVIAFFILGLLGYDVYIYIVAGQSATVSNVIIDLSHDYPAGTFLIGFTMGHLFWQMYKPRDVK